MSKINKDDPNYVYYQVGKNLKKHRKNKGLTQAKLADKCCFTENFISDLEAETFKTCSLNTLSVFAKALDISIKDFFDDLDE